MRLVPVTLREARSFVAQHHRHHRAPQGGLFAVAAATNTDIVAVAIIGRPVARELADDFTAEVTRLCAAPLVDGGGMRNACSLLYAAAWRAARALGYRRLVTYILASETGTSLRAAGWRCVAQTSGGTWDRPSRPRVDLHPLQAKLRWEAT